MSGLSLVTGCDVVDVARIGAIVERRPGFVDRVFTEREVADGTRGGLPLTHATVHARLAARYAVKEATRKALGDLGLPFRAVEVRRADDGAPRLYVHGEPSSLSCSLSHDGGVAMAVVVGARAPDAPSPPAADRPDRPPTT